MLTGRPASALIVLVFLLALPLAATGDPGDPEPSAPADSPAETDDAAIRTGSLVDLPPEAVARLAPLPARLRQILLAERGLLAPLYVEFAEETDSRLLLEIQRRIQKVKAETEISLLRAQADHARQNGRPEVAERIEEGLRRMAERDRARQDDTPVPSVRSDRPDARR